MPELPETLPDSIATEQTQSVKADAVVPPAQADQPLKAKLGPASQSALARAAAAIAKLDAKPQASAESAPEAKPGGSDAVPAPASDAAAKDGQPRPEDKVEPKVEAKPEEPRQQPERLSRAYAQLAEREAGLVARERALKERQSQWDESHKADAPRFERYRQAEETASKGDLPSALKLLGIDLRTALDAYAGTLEEPTPEQLARRAAREEWETLERQRREQAEVEAKAVREREQAQLTIEAGEYRQRTVDEFQAHQSEFKLVTAFGISPDAVWERAEHEKKLTGKRPHPLETLRTIEQHLHERVKASGLIPAPAPVAPIEDKQTPTARDTTPRTLSTSSNDAPVVRPDPAKQQRRRSAWDRANEIIARRGLA